MISGFAPDLLLIDNIALVVYRVVERRGVNSTPRAINIRTDRRAVSRRVRALDVARRCDTNTVVRSIACERSGVGHYVHIPIISRQPLDIRGPVGRPRRPGATVWKSILVEDSPWAVRCACYGNLDLVPIARGREGIPLATIRCKSLVTLGLAGVLRSPLGSFEKDAGTYLFYGRVREVVSLAVERRGQCPLAV